jgi:hypothetical protein
MIASQVMMPTNEYILSGFNKKYGQSALLIDGGYDSDIGIYHYQIHKINKYDKVNGKVFLENIGSYVPDEQGNLPFNMKYGFSFFEGCQHKGVPFYPISRSTVARISIEYKQTSYTAYGGCSSCENIFERFWVKSFDNLLKNCPQESLSVKDLVISEIKKLSNIAVMRDYSRNWVYYKFMDKVQTIDQKINNEILQNTPYYYSSQLAYNQFSWGLVQSSTKDKKKDDERLFDSFYRV